MRDIGIGIATGEQIEIFEEFTTCRACANEWAGRSLAPRDTKGQAPLGERGGDVLGLLDVHNRVSAVAAARVVIDDDRRES